VTGLTGIDTFEDHVVAGHSFVRTLRLIVGGPGLASEDEHPWKYDPADRRVLDDMVTSLLSRLYATDFKRTLPSLVFVRLRVPAYLCSFASRDKRIYYAE
jgi:hypothetical protein